MGGFILRPKTDGNFVHWRAKIKEIQDSLDNTIIEVFYVSKLEIDTTYGNDEVFLENDSINIDALNGNNRIKYQHVMLLKKNGNKKMDISKLKCLLNSIVNSLRRRKKKLNL
jgi:hypothetical protein